MKKLIFMFASLLMLVSCGNKSNNSEDNIMKKVLVIYYSQTGATDSLAQDLQMEMNADIERIEAVVPYNGDFQQTIERCQKEMADSVLPEIENIKYRIDDYDLVMIGYPIWFGEAARPMLSFINKYDLSKVKVVTFCTFGSGGTRTGIESLKKYSCGKLNIVASYGIRNARLRAIPAEVNYFLTSKGLIKGDYEKKDDYSDYKNVTKKEIEIFNKACGDYPMLHATPNKFSCRTTNEGTDYIFEATDSTENGPSNIKVLVSVNYVNNLVPEFTEVIR